MAGLAVLIAASSLTHRGAVEAARAQKMPPHIPMEYLPSVESVGLVSLGHRAAMADVLWIRAVLYFGTGIERRRSFEWLSRYVDVVTALDADFKDIYLWGGTVTILASRPVTTEVVFAANAILEKGSAHFPSDWRMAESAAANCSYYVKDPSPEDRELLKACRKKFINIAALRPGAPFTMTLLAASLAEGDDQRACNLLIDAYFSRPQDPTLRQQVERRMTGGLCGAVTAEQLQQQSRRFEEAHANTYPYLPADLVVHVKTLLEAQGAEGDEEMVDDR